MDATRMNRDEKRDLYVALRALDRIVSDLSQSPVDVDPGVQAVLDAIWAVLGQAPDEHRDAQELPTLTASDVDEQDASTADISLNLFLAAVDNLLLALDDDSSCTLTAVLDSVEEYWFFVVDQEMMSARGDVAQIATEEDIAEVERHPRFVNELDQQVADRRIASASNNPAALSRY
jgi:hypothetical protein